ncbi:MAG: hypothetical protein ACKO6B_02105 [Planctomycetia bacterium]
MRSSALNRYLLAGVERFTVDDLTMLWQHQRRLVEIAQDRAQSERRISELMRAPECTRLREALMWTLQRKDEPSKSRDPVAA